MKISIVLTLIIWYESQRKNEKNIFCAEHATIRRAIVFQSPIFRTWCVQWTWNTASRLRLKLKKKSIKSNPFVFAFQAYISCALGVHRVGYVMICFGVVNAGCSLLFGSLMKFVGRQPLMALGAIVHASLVVVLLMWKPHPENPYVFYSVSGLWGVGDAVWQTQVNGEYFLHYTCCQNRIIYY